MDMSWAELGHVQVAEQSPRKVTVFAGRAFEEVVTLE